MKAAQIAVSVVAVLALAGVAAAVFALRDGDPGSQAAQIPPAATPTQTPESPSDEPTEVPPLPSPEGAATAQALPDRTSCDEIRGTSYRSPSERDFFLESCTQPALPQPAAGAPSVSADTSVECIESIEITTVRSDQTYDVAGTNVEEIADSLSANAPQVEGGPAYGLTEYSYGLDGSYCTGTADCGLGEILITADVVVTVPNLTTLGQLSSDVAQLWSDYAEQVSLHENRHVLILEEGLAEVKRQLLLIGQQADCASLDHEIDKVWAFASGQIEQRQRAFHAADAQGRGGLVVQ